VTEAIKMSASEAYEKHLIRADGIEHLLLWRRAVFVGVGCYAAHTCSTA
jgi:hypothetical protein